MNPHPSPHPYTGIRWRLQWHPLWQTSLQTPDPYTRNTLCDDSPVLDLQTRSRTRIRRWHLQRHPVWRQPGIGSANPQPYAHQKMTPPTTPCVTAWSWICEPAAVRASEDDTSNDNLCDSLPQGPPACVTAPPTPPATKPQNSANPHPPIWSKNPYS